MQSAEVGPARERDLTRRERVADGARIGEVEHQAVRATAVVEDREFAAAELEDDVAAAGDDQLVGDVDDLVDEFDRLHEPRIDRSGGLRDVEQRRGPGQIGNDREGCGDEVQERLDRRGVFLDFLGDRLDEIREVGAQVEADVLEADEFQAVGEEAPLQVAERPEVVDAIAQAPVEHEFGDDAREVRRGTGDQRIGQAQARVEVDNGLSADHGDDVEVTQLVEGQLVVGRLVAVGNIDGERGTQVRGALVVVGGELEEAERAGDAAAGD